MKNPIQRLLVALLALWAAGVAQAGIQLSTTRVIMNQAQQHVSLFAKNLTAEPYVVQAWIDGVAEEMETPFFITPPLSRFDAKVERRLSITRVGAGLPDDRESYFWINVLEIPQKKETGENSLSLAMHTRIKLFYRPTAILNSGRGPELAQWRLSRDGSACSIVIDNRSAYTINFSRIDIAGESPALGRARVAAPLGTTRIELAACPRGALQATPHVVNDYGVVEVWPAVPLSMEAMPR